MNGFELARRIKEMEQGKNTTLVAMTGADPELESQRCIEAGYAYCLGKPINVDDLQRIAVSWTESTACEIEQPSPDQKEELDERLDASRV